MSNFFFGAPGSSSGLENPDANYTNQIAPDLAVKAAFDPGYGHYEIGGILRFFRDRYYPNAPDSAGAQNDTKTGGGISLSARFPITRKFHFGAHVVAGDGTGRYGASVLPDITVHPDGTLEPLRNARAFYRSNFIRQSGLTSSAMRESNMPSAHTMWLRTENSSATLRPLQ
jgi:hypothetical protein